MHTYILLVKRTTAIQEHLWLQFQYEKGRTGNDFYLFGMFLIKVKCDDLLNNLLKNFFMP